MNKLQDYLDAIGKLRSADGFLYAGYPKFMSLFGRDSLISSLSLLGGFPDIARSSIESLMKFQGKSVNHEIAEFPGKIPHEVNLDHSLIEKRSRDVPWLKYGPNYFSVDSTPLYILTIFEYSRITGWLPEVNYLESLKSAIDFILHSLEGREFLGYDKAPVAMGLGSQCWRDGIGDILERMKSPVFVSGVQGFLVESLDRVLNSVSEVRDYLGSDRLNDISESISLIRKNFHDRFWIEENEYPALAIDGDGVACRVITSDPLYCLGLGMMSREEERNIVRRAMEDDLLTDYGMRSLSSEEKEFDPLAYQRGSIWPHDNFLVMRSLLRANFRKEAESIATGVFDALTSIGSFPEYYSVDRSSSLLPLRKLRILPCDPQAWTVGTYHFISENFSVK